MSQENRFAVPQFANRGAQEQFERMAQKEGYVVAGSGTDHQPRRSHSETRLSSAV